MNKLEVAIKLLQMLNERKSVTTRVIADELHVSVRTAQRYIRELSVLPCFVNQPRDNSYELYPDYKLKEALLNTSLCEILHKKMQVDNRPVSPAEIACLVCEPGHDRYDHSFFVFDVRDIDNTSKLEELIRNIRERLNNKKCGLEI
jgi:hypothetical protein